MTTARVLLFPGQGAQFVNMGRAWASASAEARAVFAEADRLLAGKLPSSAGGATLSQICFEGPADVLNRTDVSQPAIYTASVACLRGLMARLGFGASASVAEAHVLATAGLSLGEYTALHCAGAFSFEDGLNLVALRGRAMQDAAEASPSGMVALIGATEEQAQELCRRTLAELGGSGGGGEVLVCANFNAPGQVVVSGSRRACERVAASDGTASAMGLRATALPVAGAFHSPLMKPAAERLGEALAKTTISAPRCHVVSNVTALPHASASGRSIEETIRARLVEQLTSPVRWAESCAYLVRESPGWAEALGAEALGAGAAVEFHELAPGKTLAGLMRRIDKNTKVTNHDEPTA
jgi:[acyl-carrier-protein] S-malonyltransferase